MLFDDIRLGLKEESYFSKKKSGLMTKIYTPILHQENPGKNNLQFGNYFQISFSKRPFQK